LQTNFLPKSWFKSFGRVSSENFLASGKTSNPAITNSVSDQGLKPPSKLRVKTLSLIASIENDNVSIKK
jgi:hypothetical protein